MKIPATWERTFEFACHDKSCAPPPAGKGGSSPARTAGPYGYQRGDHYTDPKWGKGKVVGIDPEGIKVAFHVKGDITKIPDADVVRPLSVRAKTLDVPRLEKKVWRYIPKGHGSDDGYDAMKDAGYNSRYHRLRD